MKTLHAIILSASLCLLTLGCSDSGLVDVRTESESTAIQQDAPATALSKNEVKYFPWKERGVGTGSTTDLATTDPRADLGMECEAGEFELFGTNDATVSGLGKVIGFNNGCVPFTPGPSHVRTLYIAANGDSILKEAVCILTSPTDYVCEIIVTGGTGRFENASTPPGEPIIKTGSLATGMWTAVGRISSVGSSK